MEQATGDRLRRARSYKPAREGRADSLSVLRILYAKRYPLIKGVHTQAMILNQEAIYGFTLINRNRNHLRRSNRARQKS